MCLAFTCTAFTAVKEESTIPFVSDPITDCVVSELLLELSVGKDIFEGTCSRNPLARREKVEVPTFPVCESCGICGSFKLLAQEDMADVDSMEDEPCTELSFSGTTEGEDPTSEALSGFSGSESILTSHRK